MNPEVPDVRRIFMVLSPRALPYARLALKSLYQNCTEDFHLSLITDTAEDGELLRDELARIESTPASVKRSAAAYSFSDLSDLEQEKLGRYDHIRNFRRGHPCWRKITDPVLLSDDQDEMVLLDPDLYFPNRFSFEQTPGTGVVLMWQRPSCLLPDEVVTAAIAADIKLAHHTDIGVAQWRLPVELEWLNWLIGKLGGSRLPNSMHVESIVWAALAMHLGGGYLNRAQWVCWHRSQYKRVLRKLGVSGDFILRRDSFESVKCFHAGGQAKWWLADAQKRGMLDKQGDVPSFSGFTPYAELTPFQYSALQRRRRWLQKLGYYSIFNS